MRAPKRFFGFLLICSAPLALSVASISSGHIENMVVAGIEDTLPLATVTTGESVSEFNDFSSALAAWEDGSTLKLFQDVTGSISGLSSGTKTLDLNNHSIKNSSDVITIDGANITILDSSEEKTRHYYTPNKEGAASLSETETDSYFDGGYISGVTDRGSKGIMINSGSLTFSSGTVFGNHGGSGAGIFVNTDGQLVFEEDAAVIGNYQHNDYGSGGGICSTGTIVMTGGVVRDNTAWLGVGGVRCANGSFTMTGGEITGNYGHTWIPSGLQIDSASVSLGGSAKIHGNYYLNAPKDLGINEGNKFIDICEPFTEDAKIYIVPTNDQDGAHTQTSSPTVMTTKWSEVMGDKDPYGILYCNPIYTRSTPLSLLGEYEVFLHNGEVAVGKVSYSLSFDGNSGEGEMGNFNITKRSYTLPENGFASPEEQEFAGWKIAGDDTLYKPGDEVILNQDTTFIAQWVNAPIVSFDPNGGSGTMEEVVLCGNHTYLVPANGFEAPEGMHFIGWKETKSEKFYLPGDSVEFNADATLAAQWSPTPSEDVSDLNGKVYAEDGITPVARAQVKLLKGNELLESTFTDDNGEYHLDCPDGVYNIVVEYDGLQNTALVEVSGQTTRNVELNGAKTQSLVNIAGDEAIAVGGLEKLAKDIRDSEAIPDDTSLTLTMNIEQKAIENVDQAEEFEEVIQTQNLRFYDIKVEKDLGGDKSYLETTSDVLEIVIPFEKIAKKGIAVYSYHDDELVSYIQSDSKAAGTFSIDLENALVRIYANQFSTFAIGYTPYFSLNANISLGSYTGKVNAKLETADTKEEVAFLEEVALNEVVFVDLRKGEYLLTITWVDGVSNSLTMPITIG